MNIALVRLARLCHKCFSLHVFGVGLFSTRICFLTTTQTEKISVIKDHLSSIQHRASKPMCSTVTQAKLHTPYAIAQNHHFLIKITKLKSGNKSLQAVFNFSREQQHSTVCDFLQTKHSLTNYHTGYNHNNATNYVQVNTSQNF